MSGLSAKKKASLASELTERFAGEDAIKANRAEFAILDPAGYVKSELDLIRKAKEEAEREVGRVLEMLVKEYNGQFTYSQMKTIASQAGERYYAGQMDIIAGLFPTSTLVRTREKNPNYEQLAVKGAMQSVNHKNYLIIINWH